MIRLPSGRQLKKTKLKTFFLFVLLATLFWVLTKFSREYTETTIVKLRYTNLPESLFLAKDNLDHISFDMTNNGFEFLIHKLSQPVIEIDVMKYYDDGTSPVVVSKAELIGLLKSKLSSDVTVSSVTSNELYIKLNKVLVKKVPVIAKFDLAFKEGFKQVDAVLLVPDSVKVSGPSDFLEEIAFIETEGFSEKNIDGDLSKILKVNSESANVVVDPSEVSLFIKVEEFSQKQILLPIEVINAPPNIAVKLIPERIKINFNVSLSNFNNITTRNFKVICDFNERNEEGHFMIPVLLERPSDVLDIEFESTRIDYLIFK